MARKASSDAESGHGFNDIIGILLLGLAVLLLVSLVSYDPRDVSANAQPPNPSAHNWIGPFGAWTAHIWLLCSGAAAFLVPALLLLVGLGFFFEFFSYLRRRWAWTLVLFVCSMGLLDLWHNFFQPLERNLHVIAGGIIGNNLNESIFKNFGRPGATIIFLMLYFISLLYLTNFKLGEWIRAIWNRKAREPELSPGEQILARKVSDLKKKEKELEQEVCPQRPGRRRQAGSRTHRPRPERSGSQTGRGRKGRTPADPKEPAPVYEGRSHHRPRNRSCDFRTGPGPQIRSRQVRRCETRASRSCTGAKADPDPAAATPAEEAPLPTPPAPTRSKYQPKKPKPISVASTPMIGNYQLPSDGVPPASGPHLETHGVQGGVDGKRQVDAAHT